jgi:ribosomal protein S17E
MEIVNNVGDKYMTNKQVDELINMIAKAPYNVIAGVMDRIRNNESEFFELITPEQLQEIIDNAPASGSN